MSRSALDRIERNQAMAMSMGQFDAWGRPVQAADFEDEVR